MSRERDGVVAAARWGLLAWDGGGAPRMAPHVLWSDGAGIWLALPVGGDEAAGLRARPACALWVPPVDDGGPGVSIQGRARVFAVDDPLGLLLRGAVLSAVLASLAARSPRALARLPLTRAVARIGIQRLRGVVPPTASGMAPPLPPAVPAEVRRDLGGVRDAAVAVAGREPRILPASLGSGFRLSADEPLGPGERVAVGLVPCGGDRWLPDPALVLEGDLVAGPQLSVRRARWWFAGRESQAEAEAPPGGVVLPD